MTRETAIELCELSKSFGQVNIIPPLSLKIPKGGFCVFVGPSGCGKSTLLRLISGLEAPTSGQIYIGGRDVTALDPSDRGIAMVFQNYALYPHMTVAQNIGFSMRVANARKEDIARKVSEVADMLRLTPLLDRKPKALSGGQRQRVAIGRALTKGTDVFLFDEPLSNLDAELRAEMRVEIARLHADLGATMVFVTHDQTEAMTLADQIVVLKDGVIQQTGLPLDLYRDPCNRFVAGFIGSTSMNFLRGEVRDDILHIPGLGARLPLGAAVKLPNGQFDCGIRPEDIQCRVPGDALTIEHVEDLGGVAFIYARTDAGERLIVEHRGKGAIPRNGRISVAFDNDDVLLFDPLTGLKRSQRTTGHVSLMA
ncbi:MAG: ABC transporter ATP-binding protein [Rubellimicrobium sp.]|nr:ABC transporter ATP-binding protein [Rubellimicrobium sp.]